MRRAAVILILVILFSQPVLSGYSLEESITVAESRISFACLIDFEDEEELQGKLAAIDLGPSPGLGQEKQFSRQYLEYLLRRENIDFNSWEIPDRINVKTDLQIIGERELKEKIKEKLKGKIPGVIVDFTRGVSETAYPRGDLQLSLELGSSFRVPGNNTISLALFSKGELWKTIRIPVFLDRKIPVYLVSTDLGINQKLTEDNLEIKVMPESKLPRGFIPAGDEMDGYRTRRNLSQGSILCSHHIEETPLVERGAEIKIEIISTGFSISIPGEAMESGKKGDEIRVRNLFSGEVMQGKIIGDKKIEIEI